VKQTFSLTAMWGTLGVWLTSNEVEGQDVKVARARDILNGLERDELSRGGRPSLSAEGVKTRQLGLFQEPSPVPVEHPVLSKLRQADVDNLTPLQALSLLADLRREAAE